MLELSVRHHCLVMKSFTIFCFLTINAINVLIAQNQSLKPIRISIYPDYDTLKYSKFFSGYTIHQLKSDPTYLISTISRVYFTENRIIAFGKSDNARIHLFDKFGNYISSIGFSGRGPEEYSSIRSAKINEINDLLEVLDYDKNDILKFSLKNGKFVTKTDIPNYITPDDFEKIDNSRYVFFEKYPMQEKNSKRIKFYNLQTGKTTNEYFSYNPILEGYLYFGELTNLYRYNDTICFFTSFTDTIYTIHNDRMYPRYIFEPGRYSISRKVLYNRYNNVMEFGKKCIESSCIWDINTILETDDYLFFRFRFREEIFYSFFDKHAHSFSCSNYFFDDLCLGITGKSTELITPIGSTNTSLLFRIEPYYFKKYIDAKKKNLSSSEWLKYVNSHKKVIELFNSLDINDNSLIIEFFLK